ITEIRFEEPERRAAWRSQAIHAPASPAVRRARILPQGTRNRRRFKRGQAANSAPTVRQNVPGRMEWTPEMSRTSRPPRGFRPVTLELEGRLLLANGHSAARVGNYVQFRGIPGSGSPSQAEVVGQQDGSVTVLLARTRAKGTLTVHM